MQDITSLGCNSKCSNSAKLGSWTLASQVASAPVSEHHDLSYCTACSDQFDQDGVFVT